jgi:pectate lyase
VTPHRARSEKQLLAGALALFAAGCGDGMDVQLGTKREFPVTPDGGTGDAGPSDASQDADGGNPDSPSGCPNGNDIVAPLLDLLSTGDRIGFGAEATGGKDGCVYQVTDFSDGMQPGTLRYGLQSPDPLWITFDPSGGTIVLTENLLPLSNKTIDGRGTRTPVRLQNFGIEIASQQENFIIHKLEFVGDPDLAGTEDAITMREGAHRIWIDHCDFSAYNDSLVDVIDGATDVTISWSHFHDQRQVMLLGSENDGDAGVGSNMRVTLHHNWFDRTFTWHPRARWGKVHEFNNLFEAWETYCLGPTSNVRVISERNIYLADSAVSVNAIRTDSPDTEETVSPFVWSDDDSFRGATEYVNAAGLTRAGVFEPRDYYSYMPTAVKNDDTVLNAVRDGAGVR